MNDQLHYPHDKKSINEKGVFIKEMVSGKLIRKVVNDGSPDFSKKEFEFSRPCCSELTYKEIAEQMFVSSVHLITTASHSS